MPAEGHDKDRLTGGQIGREGRGKEGEKGRSSNCGEMTANDDDVDNGAIRLQGSDDNNNDEFDNDDRENDDDDDMIDDNDFEMITMTMRRRLNVISNESS